MVSPMMKFTGGNHQPLFDICKLRRRVRITGFSAGHGKGCSTMAARAERHLAKALRLAPDLDSARHNLGNLYFQTGRFQMAATQFRAFLARQPDDWSAGQTLGESCLKSDLADEAAADRYALGSDLVCSETITRFLLNRERTSAGPGRETWKMPLRRIR